eukprot:87111-Prorocentrum_minimum.AAC.1
MIRSRSRPTLPPPRVAFINCVKDPFRKRFRNGSVGSTRARTCTGMSQEHATGAWSGVAFSISSRFQLIPLLLDISKR